MGTPKTLKVRLKSAAHFVHGCACTVTFTPPSTLRKGEAEDRMMPTLLIRSSTGLVSGFVNAKYLCESSATRSSPSVQRTLVVTLGFFFPG